MSDEPEYLTLQEAAEVLGVSRWRMWMLVKNGELEAITSPLDRRVKLVRQEDIDRLARYIPKKGAA
jgi:excisionase family DNA binding protein